MNFFLDDPTHRKVMSRVYHHHELDQFDRAADFARRAIAQRPDWWEGYSWLAGLLVEIKRRSVALPAEHPELFKEPLGLARKGVELMPAYTFTWETLGWAERYVGHFRRAIRCYAKALSLQPDCALCMVSLASCTLEALPKRRRALKAAQVAHLFRESTGRRHSQTASFWCEWGYAFELLGNIPRAERCYERTLAIRPTHAMAVNNLGEIALARGDIEAAQGLFRKALSLEPGHARFQWNLKRLPHAPLVQKG